MADDQVQQVDVGIIPDSPAQQRLWDEIKAATKPSTATVLSDGSGKWFHAFCARCGWRGQAAKDRKLIQARVDQHNAHHKGGMDATPNSR